MSEPLKQVSFDLAAGWIRGSFERSLYPLDAVYGAAYIFIDRCYVLLDVPDAEHLTVELRSRGEGDPLDEVGLRGLIGEFSNELLTQAWRAQITEHNRPIIEAVAAHALAGAVGPAPVDDGLADLDFSADAFDDPLGIAMSWEEKYGKTPAEAPTEGVPREAPPSPDATDDGDPDEGGK